MKNYQQFVWWIRSHGLSFAREPATGLTLFHAWNLPKTPNKSNKSGAAPTQSSKTGRSLNPHAGLFFLLLISTQRTKRSPAVNIYHTHEQVWWWKDNQCYSLHLTFVIILNRVDAYVWLYDVILNLHSYARKWNCTVVYSFVNPTHSCTASLTINVKNVMCVCVCLVWFI